MPTAASPLAGLRIVEMAGIGPAPMAATLLADLGADVVRIERPGSAPDPIVRARRRVVLDLSRQDDRRCALDLIARSEALIEGFRPGVMERLDLGPAQVHAANPGLTYVRVTGWGQDGPLAYSAGHDINYIAVAGVLGRIGDETPVVPLNLIGDYGGGAMFAVSGLLAGVMSARAGAPGRVVDVAMAEGAAYLMTKQFVWAQAGGLKERGRNLLDGGAWFYTTYRCADGRHVAVGAIEPKFRNALKSLLAIDPATMPDDEDPANWPRWRDAAAESFVSRSRDAWVSAASGLDACISPVLDLDEVPDHPQFRSRSFFRAGAGGILPVRTPRFADGSSSEADGCADEIPIGTMLREWSADTSNNTGRHAQ